MRHTLTNIDTATKTADCIVCGRVEVRQRRNGQNRPMWRCRTVLRAQDKRQAQSRNRRVLSNRDGGYVTITHAEIFRRMVAQRGLCAICGRKRRLVVDHNHSTRKIRQLLCWRCNTVIGFVDDSTTLLQSMVEYINRHRE